MYMRHESDSSLSAPQCCKPVRHRLTSPLSWASLPARDEPAGRTAQAALRSTVTTSVRQLQALGTMRTIVSVVLMLIVGTSAAPTPPVGGTWTRLGPWNIFDAVDADGNPGGF